MAFHVGQKVVCVGGKGTPKPPGFWDRWVKDWRVTLPKKDEVYTVRDIRLAKDGSQRLRLIEIVNPPAEFSDATKQEPWFFASHFRPIVERKTDISVFTRMLTDKRESVDA